MKGILLGVIVPALLLGACTPAAPKVDPAQIQASAVAAANTMIAQTQAAVPTDTPLPPTEEASPTPLPSPTLMALPTLAFQASPTLAASGSDDCNHLLDVGASGPQASLVIRNNTKGSVNFSLGINSKNSFGQCGYMAWGNIPKGDTLTVSVPLVRPNQGDPCYWGYAWINDPKNKSTASGGGFCINSNGKWFIDVYYDKMKLTPP